MSVVPQVVGVLGGGRMGVGIAHAFLLAGAQVVVLERDAALAEQAATRVLEALSESERRGVDQEIVERARSGLQTTTSIDEINTAELVIEAVPEDLAMKVEMLSAAARVAPQARLASNTSSLSIDAIAAGLLNPEQLLGLHFFNPVPASKLIEIVVGKQTEAEYVDQARGWVVALGKTPITVKDSPGFASSRLGVALAIEAIRMVEEGVASAADIDLAMTLGYRHPVGPLRTTDLVGLDVRLAIAEYLASEFGPRFEPPALMRSMVQEGKLGMKTGEGFFTWPSEGA